MKTTTIRKIALAQLVLAPENARRKASSAEADAQLATSIAAHGLKQNLGVYADPDGKRFLVHAGGRRLRALQQLALDGVIDDADYKVPCIVEEAEDAREISLVENALRDPMHPADEYEAFAALVTSGSTEDEVAARFGCTTLHVRKRMKLAGVAPELLERYRDGTINLDTLMAFTISDNHATQRAAFSQIEPQLRYGGSPAYMVRNILTSSKQSASSKLGRLVGVERYEAAGGTVTRDLFADANNVFFDDGALLERLAEEVLGEKAAELRREWKWAEPIMEMPWHTVSSYGRVYPTSVDVDPALAAELESLEARIKEVSDLDEEAFTEELAAEHDRLLVEAETIEAKITDAEYTYSDEAKAISGCLVTVDHAGSIKIEPGLVRPEDIPTEVDIEAEDGSGDAGESTDGETTERPNVDGDAPQPISVRIEPPRYTGDHQPLSGYAPTAVPSTPPAQKEAGISAALAGELRATRHQIMQAHLAADFGTAFDLALYSMCKSALSQGYSKKPLDISLTPAATYGVSEVLKDTVAARILEAQRAGLPLDWLTQPAPKDFMVMSALQPEEKQTLFAWVSSHALIQQLSTDNSPNPVFEEAGRRMAVDVAACWRPTHDNYWNRVKKAHALAVARDMIGDRWADDHAKDKKGEIATAMDAAFSEAARERAGLTPETAAKTARWIPEEMRFDVTADDRIAEISADDSTDVDSDEEATEPLDGDEEDSLPAFLTVNAA